MSLLDEGNDSLKEYYGLQSARFRPRYHFTSPTGWINDPNGFTFYHGEYHLFYQYDPYHLLPGVMHWGHASSKDLIVWQHLPIALAPDQDYDRAGVWSGSAIEKDGLLYLLYTGVMRDSNGTLRQTQNVAISEDGIHFRKFENNPVITNDAISAFASKEDFRDPYIVRRLNDFLVLIGTHSEKEAFVVAYQTVDLLHYRYAGIVARSPSHGTMFECPSYIDGGAQSALIVSPQNLPPEKNSFWNISSSVYFPSGIHPSVRGKTINRVHEIDGGTDFYAPQIATNTDKAVMIAWMQMWGRRYYLSDINAGWNNSMTLPRQITMRRGKLFQSPWPCIKHYYANPVIHSFSIDGVQSLSDVVGNVLVLHMTVSVKKNLVFEVCLLKKKDNYVSLRYEHATHTLTLDRRPSGIGLGGLDQEKSKEGFRNLTCQTPGGALSLDVFLDVTTVEVFVNHGQQTMTMLAYSEGTEIEFRTNQSTSISITKKDIVL